MAILHEKLIDLVVTAGTNVLAAAKSLPAIPLPHNGGWSRFFFMLTTLGLLFFFARTLDEPRPLTNAELNESITPLIAVIGNLRNEQEQLRQQLQNMDEMRNVQNGLRDRISRLEGELSSFQRFMEARNDRR